MRSALLAISALAPSVAAAQTNIELLRVEAPTEGVAGADVEVSLVLDLQATFAVEDLAWEVLLVPGANLGAGVRVRSGTLPTLAGPRTLDATVTLPGDRVGLWRLAARVDPGDDVGESNEFDNVAFAPDPIRIASPRPDFAVSEVSASASEVRAAGALTIEARVENRGSLRGTATAQAVLSAGGLPTDDDPALGSTAIDLAPGASTTVSVGGTVPELLAGAYRAGVRLSVDQPDANPADDVGVAASPVVLIKDTLEIRTTALIEGVVGLPYSLELVADGGDGDIVFARTSGDLPAGLRLQDGALSGTPRESGRFSFTLEARSRGLVDRQAFELEILPTEAVLAVVTSTLPPGRLGVPYGHVLVAGGGEAPYAWTVAEGSLPPGLGLDDELLGGEPAEVGQFEFTLEVSDRLGDVASRSFAIEISTSNAVLVDPSPLPVAAAGIRYEAQLSATGGVPPYRWRALSDLPVGLSLDPNGRVFGTPGRPGDFIFRVEVTDSTDAEISDRSLLFLEVEDADNFTITRPEIPTLRFGNRFELVFSVEGGAAPYTWSLAPGSRIPRNTFFANGEGDRLDDGVFFGAPSELGTFGLGVVVEDARGRRREAELAVRVERAGSLGDDGGGCRSTPVGSGAPLLGLLLGWVLLARTRRRRDRRGASRTFRPASIVRGSPRPPPAARAPHLFPGSAPPGGRSDPRVQKRR